MMTYNEWTKAGMPMSEEFKAWIDKHYPDWALEYSGDTYGMLDAWEAGRQSNEQACVKAAIEMAAVIGQRQS